MGEQRVSALNDEKKMQKFVKALLADVQAMEYMLEHKWFESGTIRIGAEQEMVMVNKQSQKPACVAMEALEKMKDYDWVETELAKFNLETNLTPRKFIGSCFSDLEKENSEKLDKIQEVLDTMDTDLVLTGILPTLKKRDLIMDNLTPKKRYYALMEAINQQLIGNSYELKLSGIDELALKHDSPLLEAVNTSFQIHLQIEPSDFVKMYNIAQAITGPVMAISANSPLVFGKRLWHESRIAMFQQALDTRSSHDHMRERSARVSFGRDWLHKSIMEIYKEDIARFRVLLSSDVKEDSLACIKKGEIPRLRSLQVHNSTVYRWNRPCYGISDNGKPHLRIENRVIAAGPTVIDEVASACFWLGLMEGMAQRTDDITKHISFEDARDNFAKAAQFGIDSKFNWFDDEKIPASQLIREKLIPIAREGLEYRKVNKADIDKYLGVIEERAKKHMTGARWMLRGYSELKKTIGEDEALRVITAEIVNNQKKNIPVHNWPAPDANSLKQYKISEMIVSDFMVTDLFTVQKNDIIQLVAELMDWNKIKYTPVEDAKGKLIGLVSARLILRELTRNPTKRTTRTVEDIMVTDIVTVTEETTIKEAIRLMREHDIGCLPVVVNGVDLVGLITENDFIRISRRLIERMD